jgi:hypothetical protein
MTTTPTPTPDSDERTAAFQAWYKAERFGDPAYQNVWHAACEWQAARSTPPGWVIVPREPTETMVSVGDMNHMCGAAEVYRAMLAAAPLPPEPAGDDK